MSESRAGWYPDPSGNPSKLRYWDGSQWTDDYADSPSNAQDTPASEEALCQVQAVDSAQVSYGMTSQDSTLRLIAFVFCLISTVTAGWMLIPLAWMIPMSVHAWGIYKGKKPNTVAFGVCTLIFVSLIGGILLLVSKKDA
ncbi:MAG: DUF2510 domain-containing protein [Coriobacteriales bacterium]